MARATGNGWSQSDIDEMVAEICGIVMGATKKPKRTTTTHKTTAKTTAKPSAKPTI
jgi:hypothetical protein